MSDKKKVRLNDAISFGDALFAFSITIMTLSIQLPDIQTHNLTQSQIISELLELRPQFESYVISFFVIGVYWISYHIVFNHIIKSYSTTTWLNLLFLFFITLISFATSLLITYGNYSFVFILYNVTLIVTGTQLCLIWINAVRLHHVDETLNAALIKNILMETLVPPIIFTLAIGVFFINPGLAHYFWILILPAKIIIRKTFPYK
jgi:uncharacterized membrane protein